MFAHSMLLREEVEQFPFSLCTLSGLSELEPLGVMHHRFMPDLHIARYGRQEVA